MEDFSLNRGLEDDRPVSRNGKKERTRARLLAAAEDVFGVHGFTDASIVEITQRAGVALGTFYVYFPSKTAIFSHILESRLADLRDAIREAVTRSSGGGDTERAVLRAFLDWVSAHPNAYRALRNAEYVEGARVQDWYAGFVKSYAERLARAMDAGTIRRTDPEILASALAGMAELVATRWIAWVSEDADRISHAQVDVFLDIATRAMGLVPTPA